MKYKILSKTTFTTKGSEKVAEKKNQKTGRRGHDGKEVRDPISTGP